MAITDLTGTTWRINDVPVISTTTSYYINFVDANNGNYTRITFTQSTSINYRQYQSDWVGVYDSRGWGQTYYQTITITGGTDVTNADLISWIEANATQVQTTMIYTTTGTELSSIADAIRSATGEAGNIEYPDGFINEINSIKPLIFSGEFTTPSDVTTSIGELIIPYDGNGYIRYFSIFGTGATYVPWSYQTYNYSVLSLDFFGSSATPTYTGSGYNNEGHARMVYNSGGSPTFVKTNNVGVYNSANPTSVTSPSTSLNFLHIINKNTIKYYLTANDGRFGFFRNASYRFLIEYVE